MKDECVFCGGIGDGERKTVSDEFIKQYGKTIFVCIDCL